MQLVPFGCSMEPGPFFRLGSSMFLLYAVCFRFFSCNSLRAISGGHTVVCYIDGDAQSGKGMDQTAEAPIN